MFWYILKIESEAFCFTINIHFHIIDHLNNNFNLFTAVRDLYELLMEKQLLADAYVQPSHRLVRKSSKLPSLRLRFGRRSDPSMFQVYLFKYSKDSRNIKRIFSDRYILLFNLRLKGIFITRDSSN